MKRYERAYLILCTSLTSNGIQLIDEDDSRSLLPSSSKQFPNTLGYEQVSCELNFDRGGIDVTYLRHQQTSRQSSNLMQTGTEHLPLQLQLEPTLSFPFQEVRSTEHPWVVFHRGPRTFLGSLGIRRFLRVPTPSSGIARSALSKSTHILGFLYTVDIAKLDNFSFFRFKFRGSRSSFQQSGVFHDHRQYGKDDECPKHHA